MGLGTSESWLLHLDETEMSGEPLAQCSQPSGCSALACSFLPPLPCLNVQGYPKREAFNKASRAWLHHFCCVLAGLGVACAEDKTHSPAQDVGLDLATGR